MSETRLRTFALKRLASEEGAIENLGIFLASTGRAEKDSDVPPPGWIMTVRLTLLKSLLSSAFWWAFTAWR